MSSTCFEAGRSYSGRMGNRWAQNVALMEVNRNFIWEVWTKEDYLEELGIGEKIILKWIWKAEEG